ncbi:MAG: long-chain fatty acid--CoA ligase [Bacteroidetes bacterium]|nr:MAG: long-chain fatty acid--CoA ligase [Bacteroidota bacterium]
MTPTRIFDLLERFLKKFPGQDVLAEKIEGKWVFYTSEQYHEIAHNFAYGLLELGFEKGDKLVTVTNNRPQWNFVDMGMAMAGVVHVPVYTSMNSEEYKYILNHSDGKMVLVSDQKLFDVISPLAEQVKHVEHFYTFNEIPRANNWMEVVEKGRQASDDIKKTPSTLTLEMAPTDRASSIYTSGTTGTSKGVMLSHDNMVQNFLAGAEIFQLTPEDRFLSIIPTCHVGGRFGNYQTQYSGACIYYAENMGTIAINLREIKATGFDAVPRILEKIFDTVLAKGRALKGIKKKIFFWAVSLGLRYEPHGIKSWFYYRKLKIADKLIFSKWREALGGEARLVGCGAASLQPRLERVFWASGLKILNIYGLTETSPITTINRPDKENCRLGTVGSLIDGVELKIAEDGEILCRGHNVMIGYYKDEALTKSVIDEEGWFHTGDVGHLKEGKFLVITDRKKEIFKLSNGKFVAPQPIENKIKESAFIDQVMVVGENEKFASALLVPDSKYLKEWCNAKNLAEGKRLEDLIQLPEVQTLFNEEIAKTNKTLSDWERISRFKIVADDWSPATGELSASLKLKRRVVESNYPELLDAIYQRKS